jgi:hypothetical protein
LDLPELILVNELLVLELIIRLEERMLSLMTLIDITSFADEFIYEGGTIFKEYSGSS